MRVISRIERLVVAIAGLALFASLFLLVHPWYDLNRDATLYLTTAQSLLAGEGYSYLSIPYLARPPGFPVLLTLPLGLLGLNFHVLNFYVAFFGAIAVVLLYFQLRRNLEPALALLVCASLWLLPGYQTLCNRVMSDAPGLALLLACLLLERWAARMPSLRRELLLGAAIGLSALVRSVNVLLVPAIVLARTIVWFRSGRGRASPASFAGQQVAPLALAAALILLPWGVRNQLVNPAPPADQVTVYSYSAGMWHSDRGDPDSPTVEIAEVLDRVPDRVIQLVHVLGSALAVNASGSKPPDHGVAPQHALFALLLLLGLTYGLAKRREPMEFFALGALATISIYFSFQNRLVLPIYVICLGATVEMGRDLVRRVASPRVAVVAVALALVVLALFRFEPRRGWDRIRENHLSMLSDVAAIERVSEPDACLAASAGFHYTLYLERPVYSLQMAIRRAGGVQGAEAMIDKYGVDTLALFGDKKMERELLAYARSKYGPGQRVGTGYLFRVRAPGTPCGSRRR